MSDIKVGDEIRVLVYGYCFTNLKAGDITKVVQVFSENFTVEDIYAGGVWYMKKKDLGTAFEVVEQLTEETLKETPARIDGHYDFFYDLNRREVEVQQLKIDPYFVAKQWRIGERDPSGVLFHILKTVARFGDKNSEEREIKAIYLQIKRLAELKGVELE